MEKPYFRVKKLKEAAILPSKRDEDAGYDLYGVVEENFILLKPGDIRMFSTGISIEIPKDWVFYVAERGSTGSKGIARRCGVVDSGYRGEIFVPLNNTSNKPILFYREDNEFMDEFLKENSLERTEITLYPISKAITQGMLLYCPHVEVEEVDELQDSIRGENALGSSGK